MSFYNTGNPVPSIDPRDLDDNAKHLDEFVNGTDPTYTDRLGVERKTLSAIESDADSELLRNDLASSTDPTLGADLVGAVRMFVAKTINRVSGFLSSGTIDPLEYGSLIVSRPDPNDSGTWDATAAIEAAIAAALSSKWAKRVSLSCDLGASRTILIPSGVSFDCAGGALVALPGFTALTPVLQFGQFGAVPEPSGRYTGWSPKIHVKCNDQRVIGVEFSRPWAWASFPSGLVEDCAYIGVHWRSGNGLHLGKWRCGAPLALTGKTNAQVDSIGYWLRSSDSVFGTLDCVGFFTGVNVSGNNNSFDACHPWGLYQKAGVPQSCPMGIGIRNSGQSNTFKAGVVDSVALVDYSQPASLTNGGIGVLMEGNAYQSKLFGMNIFMPDRSADGETAPAGVVEPFRFNVAVSAFGCEATNYNAVSPFTTNHYNGSAVDTSQIMSRHEPRLYAVKQFIFNRKVYFRKGFEFSATYQDPDENSGGYGVCSFAMPTASYLQINTNYEGTSRVVYLQRRSVAYAAGDLTSIAATLTTAERGRYSVWYEPTKKRLEWDGTAWRDTMGNLV